MPSKVYVTNYPAGDFRAMPAIGDGHALLKWVTSFPGNPARGLPTVTGLVLLSDAEDGRLLAVLRRGRRDGTPHCGRGGTRGGHALPRRGIVVRRDRLRVNGAETARMLVAHGVTPLVWDVDAGTSRVRRRASRRRVGVERRRGTRV